MIKSLRKNLLAVIASLYSLIVALFWLALRVNWSGISKALGADTNRSFFVMETPLIICVFLWLAFAFSLFAMFFWSGERKRKAPFIASLSVSGVFTIVIAVVIAMGAADYMDFILPKFFTSLAVSVLIIAFALLLFFPPVSNCKKCLIIKSALLLTVVLGSVLFGYGIKANYITYDAVVYAVEDKYQIVFSTNDNSIVWVEIDGEKYYDLYAGSMKSKDLVHKIEVPQEKLDEAKSYTVNAQKMIYRGPFGGYKGKVISRDYSFRPVDTSNGLKYYSMSDVHGAYKGAVNAASYHSDMDFLILLGDMFSMIDSEYDAQFANKLAFAVTKGEFPVVYVRGNHEIKGDYAEDLYKYVGSKDENFYYTFTLSDIFGVVLDIGEDHDDDWWEYYDTAQFAVYQAEQTEMLNRLVSEKPYENYNYTLAACHIPVTFVNSRKNHEEVKKQWTVLLNQMETDMFVSGHQHSLYPFVPGEVVPFEKLTYNPAYSGVTGKTYNGYYTDFEFPGFIVSRRSDGQLDKAQSAGTGKYIGLVTEVDFTTGRQTSSYTNAKGEKVHIVDPFAENDYGTVFESYIN